MPNKPEQIVIEWEQGEGFLESFEDAELATLRTELKEDLPLEVGAMQSLILRFVDRETDFQLHATLVELDGRRAKFQFLAEERTRLELVLVSARGESLPYRRRRHTRIPCDCKATLAKSGESPRVGAALNLGAGGTQLQLEDPIDADEKVQIVLSLPEDVTMRLIGRVTSRIDEGPEKGNSVEFLFRSSKERDDMAAAVERLLALSRQ